MPYRYDKDPYVLLGISPAATPAQIKEAFRRLARQHHPDLNPDPRSAERMKDINWAYGILNNPLERSKYDAWRRNPTGTESSSQPKSTQTQTNGPRPAYRTRATERVSVGGLSWIFIIWVLVSFFSNLPRSNQQKLYISTLSANQQSTMIALFKSLPLTLTATANPATGREVSAVSTSTPLSEFIDIREQLFPGRLEWGWIDSLLKEYQLTTATGLSDEVTRVQRNLMTGAIFIETQHSGTFRIYIDENQLPVSMHFPANTPASTPTP